MKITLPVPNTVDTDVSTYYCVATEGDSTVVYREVTSTGAAYDHFYYGSLDSFIANRSLDHIVVPVDPFTAVQLGMITVDKVKEMLPEEFQALLKVLY